MEVSLISESNITIGFYFGAAARAGARVRADVREVPSGRGEGVGDAGLGAQIKDLLRGGQRDESG